MTETQNNLDTKKKGLPPYLNLVKFTALVEKITKTNPKALSPSSLKDEYGATDASIAMGALRFLGIVDANGGVVTETIKKFQKLDTDARTKEISEVVKTTYGELFEHIVGGDPQDLPQKKLEGAIQEVYNVTPRIAGPAARAFVFLCEEAGLKDKKARVITPRVSSPKPKKQIPAAAHKKETPASGGNTHVQTSSDTTLIPFEGDISFVIPTKVLRNPSLITAYGEVLSAIQIFVKKCAPCAPLTENKEEGPNE